MAKAPVRVNKATRKRIFGMILKSMGAHSVDDLINDITVSDGTPDTELSLMKDYSLVWDSTNKIAYLHTTAATYVQIGQAITFINGMKNQANARV